MVNDIALDSSSSLSEDSATGQIAATGQKIGHLMEIGPRREEADFRRIGLAPRPANFRNLAGNLAVQFSGPIFLPVQFFARPIFHQSNFPARSPVQFFPYNSYIVSKNWPGEKLDWGVGRKIGPTKIVQFSGPKNWTRKLDCQVFDQIPQNWPGAGPGQFFESRPILGQKSDAIASPCPARDRPLTRNRCDTAAEFTLPCMRPVAQNGTG